MYKQFFWHYMYYTYIYLCTYILNAHNQERKLIKQEYFNNKCFLLNRNNAKTFLISITKKEKEYFWIITIYNVLIKNHKITLSIISRIFTTACATRSSCTRLFTLCFAPTVRSFSQRVRRRCGGNVLLQLYTYHTCCNITAKRTTCRYHLWWTVKCTRSFIEETRHYWLYTSKYVLYKWTYIKSGRNNIEYSTLKYVTLSVFYASSL